MEDFPQDVTNKKVTLFSQGKLDLADENTLKNVTVKDLQDIAQYIGCDVSGEGGKPLGAGNCFPREIQE